MSAVLAGRLRPETFDPESRTVEIVWTAGAAAPRPADSLSPVPYIEVLSVSTAAIDTGRLQAGAPVCLEHNATRSGQIGAVVPGTIGTTGDGQWHCLVKLSARAEVAGDVQDIADGILHAVSVGYQIHDFVVDQTQSPPVVTVTRWEPTEISFCATPVDVACSTRAMPAPTQETRMEDQEDKKPDEIVEDDQQRAEDDVPAAESDDTPADDETVRITVADRDRVIAIMEAARSLPEAVRHASAEAAIRNGLTAAQYRAIVAPVQEAAPVVKGSVKVTDRSQDMVRAAGDAIMVRSGAALALGIKDLRPGDFKGASLVDVARRMLELRGERNLGYDAESIVRRAIGQGTGDFPVLLENVMHKVLLAAYRAAPDTWRRFCAVGSVSDFRAHNRYSMHSLGVMPFVNENGEIENRPIPDATKATVAARTRAQIITLTREAIINDDLSAFNRVPTMLARSAALSIESAVYGLLAQNGGLGPVMSDGQTLFHASHGNVGVDSALSISGLDADRVLMASQTDNNEFLDIRPDVLVVPTSLGGRARALNKAENDPDVSGRNVLPNSMMGAFSDIVDTPRVSGRRRYMFADRSTSPVIEVSFLNGQEAPQLRSEEGWRVLGQEWRLVHDFGVGAVDYRGAVTNSGAA